MTSNIRLGCFLFGFAVGLTGCHSAVVKSENATLTTAKALTSPDKSGGAQPVVRRDRSDLQLRLAHSWDSNAPLIGDDEESEGNFPDESDRRFDGSFRLRHGWWIGSRDVLDAELSAVERQYADLDSLDLTEGTVALEWKRTLSTDKHLGLRMGFLESRTDEPISDRLYGSVFFNFGATTPWDEESDQTRFSLTLDSNVDRQDASPALDQDGTSWAVAAENLSHGRLLSLESEFRAKAWVAGSDTEGTEFDETSFGIDGEAQFALGCHFRLLGGFSWGSANSDNPSVFSVDPSGRIGTDDADPTFRELRIGMAYRPWIFEDIWLHLGLSHSAVSSSVDVYDSTANVVTLSLSVYLTSERTVPEDKGADFDPPSRTSFLKDAPRNRLKIIDTFPEIP